MACLPRSPGQPQHHKYQNRIWWRWSNPDPPFPLKQEEFQKTLIVVHGEEWFSLEWAHKIILYYVTLVSHRLHVNEVKMTCSGEALANVKLKWLCFPSSRITEQNLIWYVEKLQWEFIPIPIALFPFPYFYFYSHSHSHDIIIVNDIPMGIPWNPWDPNCFHSHAHL